jgi:hypothetical protein
MSKIVILFLVSMTIISGKSQNKSNSLVYETNLLKQANIMGQYYLNKKYEQFIEKIYPGIIKAVGGKQRMLQMLNSAMQNLDKQNIIVDSMRFSKPNKIIYTGEELQTTLSETVFMTIPNGTMIKESTMIAISSDKGITWSFIDTSGQSLNSLKKAFPNLSNDLIIPKDKNPIIKRN